MMYQSKLVAAIKVGGKVLREFQEVVKLPFGSEYSVYLKNLNSVKALVSVSIDGKDVLNGTQLVLNPGQEMDLKRSLNENSSTHGNAFKFIERTENIEKNRGIGAEDGLVRIEYQFEKPHSINLNGWGSNWPAKKDPLPRIPDYFLNSTTNCSYGDTSFSGNTGLTKGVLRSTNSSVTCSAVASIDSSYNVTAQVASFNETGITVPGAVVEQEFKVAGWFPVEATKHIMVLHLLGEVAGEVVKEAVTVKSKPKCVTCGKQNKATSKFCSECGTGLQLV